MKYLISGSNGFIGQRFGKYLLSGKHSVRAIPRDLLYEKWNLKRYVESEQPDIIIHLAAYGNHSTQRDLIQTVESNVLYTTNLLEASKDVDYKAFINTSTSSVYLPKQTFYSASKKATEEICKAFVQEHKKPVVTVRPYSVYGPGEAEFRFIPTVIRAAKYDLPLSLVLEPRHDWIHVDDFILAVCRAVKHADKLKGLAIDIGTGMDYSNKDVFDLIQRVHKKKINYEVVESMRSYDSDKWVCDPTLINSLGWYPSFNLEEGIEDTYANY